MAQDNIVEEVRVRVIRNFMDLFILDVLKSREMSGYDFISLIHRRFDVLVSSGTVYTLLYSMERKGLIKGRSVDRKRVYTLTEKGKKSIQQVEKSNGAIQVVLKNLIVM